MRKIKVLCLALFLVLGAGVLGGCESKESGQPMSEICKSFELDVIPCSIRYTYEVGDSVKCYDSSDSELVDRLMKCLGELRFVQIDELPWEGKKSSLVFWGPLYSTNGDYYRQEIILSDGFFILDGLYYAVKDSYEFDAIVGEILTKGRELQYSFDTDDTMKHITGYWREETFDSNYEVSIYMNQKGQWTFYLDNKEDENAMDEIFGLIVGFTDESFEVLEDNGQKKTVTYTYKPKDNLVINGKDFYRLGME